MCSRETKLGYFVSKNKDEMIRKYKFVNSLLKSYDKIWNKNENRLSRSIKKKKRHISVIYVP